MVVNPSPALSSLLFFFPFPSILPSFGKLTGGRERGEEENTAELENGKPSKEKERNDSKRVQQLEISTVGCDQGKRGQARKYENYQQDEKYRSRCEKLKGKSALNATIQERENMKNS